MASPMFAQWCFSWATQRIKHYRELPVFMRPAKLHGELLEASIDCLNASTGRRSLLERAAGAQFSW